MQHILERFTGVIPVGAGWRALCPCHADFHPSVSIDPGASGKTLLRCRVGCPTVSLLQATGLTWADLDGGSGAGVPIGRRALPDEAERDLRSRVYSGLIERLRLHSTHRDSLLKRGLSDAWIERAEYRSLRFLEVKKALRALHTLHGQALFDVPGFYQWERGLRLTADDGLLIPVRDPLGRILGCQVRTDRQVGKYMWFSSRKVSTGSPCHTPHTAVKAGVPVWVTEGPLKADVTTHLLSGPSVLGVGGVTAWRAALMPLHLLRAEEVVLAYDTDWRTNQAVRGQLEEFGDTLVSHGYRVLRADWVGHKGIDDLLREGGKYTLMPWCDEPTGAVSPQAANWTEADHRAYARRLL